MPTALVVDDEKVILTFVERVLEPSGYAVLKAGSGQEALNLLNQNDNQIGFLLTDVRMPEMGGAELAQHVLHLRPGLPVIFMSGTEFPGLGHFLLKPFTATELLNCVHRATTSVTGA
jgi:CheY-like chemotaxis protein